MLFVGASLMGNFFGIEWYTIHIFDIFSNIPELSNIFKAIMENIRKLTILAVLVATFILIFNVLSLNTYTSVIYD